MFGKITVTNAGELQVLQGQIQCGLGAAVEDSSSGSVVLANVGVQSLMVAGDVVVSDGNLFYTHLVFVSPFQTVASAATRLPGTDAQSSEAFVAQVSNAAAFDAPTTNAWTNLVYGTVVQNTAPVAVFDPQLDGSIIVRRAGVLSIASTLTDASATGSTAVSHRIRVNGVDVTLAAELRTAVGAQIHRVHQLRVAANDVVTLQANPSEIEVTATGVTSQVAMTWTGVR